MVALDDELQAHHDEIHLERLHGPGAIGLDFLTPPSTGCLLGDWHAQRRKALLSAFLAPARLIQTAEAEATTTRRLALLEERRTLPLGAVWNYYCLKQEVPPDGAWLPQIVDYEKTVLSKRG